MRDTDTYHRAIATRAPAPSFGKLSRMIAMETMARRMGMPAMCSTDQGMGTCPCLVCHYLRLFRVNTEFLHNPPPARNPRRLRAPGK
ncbi:MAG: hypothetical protein GY696_30475 [Gammaproteobacteria bacterium]|nr:hypothetical protein [Gammaproteobacteria bacterium]